MAEPSRYDVNDKDAGIKHGVLINKLGIKNQKTLDDAETILLNDAYAYFFDLLEKEKLEFTLDLLFDIHRYFLKPLYPWAGKVRAIDISKDGMLFAPVRYIDSSLKSFKKILKKQSPTEKDSKKQIAHKLAVIHNEFNAIHPFREGNGRTIRLFLDLLATQNGYGTIDWEKKTQTAYVKACIKGMEQNHKPMENLIYAGLKK